ncbi:MAG: PEP-CTERM sorting domain-containing protein [Opitutaceae bacterium]|jgi:hypothetical protein|nr:PEP-CTERM sorting domain-containing protein [Opitutaceae bacterium]
MKTSHNRPSHLIHKLVAALAIPAATIMASASALGDAPDSGITWTNVFTEDNTDFSQWNLGTFADRASIANSTLYGDRFSFGGTSPNINISTIEKFTGVDAGDKPVSLKLTVGNFHYKTSYNHNSAQAHIGVGNVLAVDLFTYGGAGCLYYNGTKYNFDEDKRPSTSINENTTKDGVSLELLYLAETRRVILTLLTNNPTGGVAGTVIFDQVMNAPLDPGATGTALNIFYNTQYNGGFVGTALVGDITLDYGVAAIPESATWALLFGGASILAALVNKRHRH